MEKNEEVKGRLLAVNGVRKCGHRISGIRDYLGEEEMADHESTVLENKSIDWNRGLMNIQKKKRKKSRTETGKNGDDDRRIHRNRNFLTIDEIVIGVSVPRRKRSVSMKRLNRNWSFRDAGFGGGLSHHRIYEVGVGLGRRVSTTNGGLRENKKSFGQKMKRPEAVGVAAEDEIEVVEALFDLMNQTHSESDRSKKNEIEPVCTSGSDKEPVSNKKIVKSSYLPRKSGRDDGLGKKGVGFSGVNDDLISEDEKNLARSKYSVRQSENLSPLSNNGSVGKEKVFDKKGEVVFNDLKRISSKKRVVAPQDEEFPLAAESQNSDKQVDSILLEGNPAADLMESKREAKFQSNSMMKIADEVVEKEQENKVEKSYMKQGSSKLEQYASTCSGRSELVGIGEELKQYKAPISGHKYALPNSLPSANFGAGWARGLPHPGFMPPYHMVMPNRNIQPFTSFPVFMQHPPSLAWQPRRKRSATHQYIAHNILSQQQLIKNLTSLPATASPASIYRSNSMAPTPDALISKTNKTAGDKFRGKNLDKTMLSALGGDKTFDAGNNVNVSNNNQWVFQQAPQQISTANVLAPALVAQLGQHQTLMVPPTNQNAAVFLNNSVRGALGSSSSSPVVSQDHINHLSKTVPPHMTLCPNKGNPSPFSNTNTNTNT